MSSGISRILCHQEYQEYYVISNIWNKCQQETGILCYQEHQEYIMSSGINISDIPVDIFVPTVTDDNIFDIHDGIIFLIFLMTQYS
jgi:hypothetical protein